MRRQLLRWQWSLYPDAHRHRLNLVLHVLTAPLFMLGTVGLALAWRWPWLGLAGLVTMILVMAVQGRGHSLEGVRPVPFAGAGDVISRFFAEQWVTFPRYLLTGGLARAWRARE